MGGGSNNYKKKSFGLLSIFKTKRSPRGDEDEFVKAYKVYPSDEDRGRWVAEPGIDRKASAYIATIQANWNTSAGSN